MNETKKQPDGSVIESSTLLEAIDCLTKAIGTYGERFKKEISLHWGNGVILRENGVMLSGGRNNCAKAISELASNKVI